MRVLSVRFVAAAIVAGFTVVTGCSSAPSDPDPSTDPAAAPAPAEQVGDQVTPQSGICPLMWTCDFRRYYSTQASCTAACGSRPCERDYYCRVGCICP